MKGQSLRIAILAALVALSCSSAQAVTWFDSNVRPDGVSDNSNPSDGSTAYQAPQSDDGNIYASSQSGQENNAEVISEADVFDSGD